MAATFTYSEGRYFRDGRPFFVIGVEVQYYRLRREVWEDRLRKLAAAHANTITFYVPWRHHLVSSPGEPQRFDFDGSTKDSRDLRQFLGLCTRLGLLMIAKPGPFVHSELNIGGLPDVASPTYNPAIRPVRKSDGSPLRWSYDDAILPSPEDAVFDGFAREWLEAAGAVLRPHASPTGNLIGIQLNDETLYCTSNNPPWDFGYEMRPGPWKPSPDRPLRTEADLEPFKSWADFQWQVRHDAYARYRRYLGVESLTHLSNYAGITPPIEENVPGKEGEVSVPKDDFSRLYSEWWFAMNRIEADLDICEYGIISWLGVAAYDEAVFSRYVNTARRRRGLNMEENWGFATLYHRYSKHPLVPFFQTLVSVAGGCTGYAIFTGLNHDYWDDSLDRITKKQCPTFPSDAPIAADGSLTPMYDTMKLMNAWFAREGEGYLGAEMPADVCFLVYAPYAAISGWVPNGRSWKLPHAIPRCGLALEPLAREMQERGHVLEMLDLAAASPAELAKRRICAFLPGFFMDAATRAKLDAWVAAGGVLLEPGDVVAALPALGIRPRVQHGPGLRAFAYEPPLPQARGQRDLYLWFFGFAPDAGPHEHEVRLHDGRRVHLRLGSKTAGVVHLRGERIASVLWKGRNEVEGLETEVSVSCGADSVSHRGDLVRFFDLN